MPLRYVAGQKLLSEGLISAVAFNPSGDVVAYASLSGEVKLWDIESSVPLFVVRAKSPILCLAWSSSFNIMCGLENGTVASISYDESELSISGFAAHEGPLESIALANDSIEFATASHEEVRVWRARGSWHLHSELTDPPTNGQSARSPVIVTSIAWLNRSKEGACLLVLYMYHGVIIWNVETREVLRAIAISTPIAAAHLSPDKRSLAISNLYSGFDVYNVEKSVPFLTLQHVMGQSVATPVLFVHNGRAILGGNALGQVNLWDSTTGRHLHLLSHISKYDIPRRFAYDDKIGDRFLIATGAVESLALSYIQLWHTEEICACKRVALWWSSQLIFAL
ncbi:WD40 repeat-like protein [Artomyces pyxidatus]|uniref:WD40 repeat-like protein n=1 Tax=Artomyces pyxidatus TaxID=48021 RepID=A0ACB8SFF9_9AGAM|nr:WD40 repeat-like protein [Artomyces pyxidatus]